ncbi:hypothetical protein PFLUV_G00267950 [Perca fluviatilis]|uniref:Uncharacterized protein n=1 Tax=Perca fluviatilis TaxID=8168 RepID=A0A6A5E110_PERFL|nr:uncharacterized protein LOC120553455 [Perca fluviatilis]KAF1372635.1 hypothetical protein PFLUV_G00267950 [Perca fluviatilis]
MERLGYLTQQTERTSLLHMDIKISPDELGEERCSDLEMPLLTSETLDEVVMLYLGYITNENWLLLADGSIDSATVLLLSDLCYEVVQTVCDEVLDVVAPQVNDKTWGHISMESASNPSNTYVTMYLGESESPQREHNYHSVTVEDIQASLGHSLHQCLGEALEVVEESSDDSEQLLQLVAEEVAKKVNRTLAAITQSASSSPSEESDEWVTPQSTKHMVFHVANILSRCVVRKYEINPPEELRLLSVSPWASSPDDEGKVEDFCLVESQSSELSVSVSSVSPATTKQELSQGEKTFLAMFLGMLLDHIALSTKTSVMDLNFDGILKNLTRTVEETGFTLPQTVGNLHCTIFKKLGLEFGSTKLLRAAIVSEGMAFEEAVARELRVQQEKAAHKKPSFVTNVRRIFRRRSNKVAPACEVDTFNSQVALLESESIPRHQKKQKGPVIIGMLSAVARILKKPFTSCISRGSPDD